MLPHLGVFVSEGELCDDVDEEEAEAKVMPATPSPVQAAPNVAEDSSSGDFIVAMVLVVRYVDPDAAWASSASQSRKALSPASGCRVPAWRDQSRRKTVLAGENQR